MCRHTGLCLWLMVSWAMALPIGCQSDSSPTRWFGRSPHESSTVPASNSSDPPVSTFRAGAASGPTQTVTRQSLKVVNASFDVVRVDLPLDEFRDSRKIWNHVASGRVEPEVAVQLSRNGLQLGVGDDNAWTAIRAILEASGAEVKRDQIQPSPGAALALDAGTIAANGEAIFVYNRSDRLEGKTYEAGAKLLILDYSYLGSDHGTVDLRVGLEIRNDRGEMRWERLGDTLQQVPAVDRHQFSELRANLTLGPGEFLVIGPGELSSNAYLIGARFFAGEKDGVRRDTLFFVTPRFQESVVERTKPS